MYPVKYVAIPSLSMLPNCQAKLVFAVNLRGPLGHGLFEQATQHQTAIRSGDVLRATDFTLQSISDQEHE